MAYSSGNGITASGKNGLDPIFLSLAELLFKDTISQAKRRGININAWHILFWRNRSSYLSTQCGNHTITHYRGIRLFTATLNLLAFNISEISSNNSEKLSRPLASKHLWAFLLHSLMPVPECRVPDTVGGDNISLVFTPKKTRSWPGSQFTCNFALTYFI